MPDARGRGVAKALLVALEDAARGTRLQRSRGWTPGRSQPHAERCTASAGYADIANFNANPFASYWGEKRL